MQKTYDYLIIGSGPAGHMAAIRAAQLGLKTAVIEKNEEMFGGTCLNEGCIPAKSLYHSAKVFDIIKNRSGLYGLEVQCNGVNLPGFVKKSREDAEQLKKGLSFLFRKNGIDLLSGHARFVDRNTVSISEKSGKAHQVKAKNFLIAAGAVPRSLREAVFDGKHIITSSHAIRLDNIPKRMLIVGGGVIGTEFASFFNLIGAEVSIVEVEDCLLPGEDKEISRCMQSIFKKKGIQVFTASRIKNISVKQEKAVVNIEGKIGHREEAYEMVLISVGRSPCTSDVGLEQAGVQIDDEGFIPVNKRMCTNIDNIYAAGDVLKTPMLAHTASAEGEIAAEAAAGHIPEIIDYSLVPNVVYSEIQAASVGMTEEQARLENINIAVGKHFFKSNGLAVINSESEGFIKVIADKTSRRLLGAHIVGYRAAELIHEFVIAKRAGLTASDIAGTVHAHPTFSEAAADACRTVF